MDTIKIAETDAEIQRCFPVLRQLQEHIVEATFIADVRRLGASGYQLAYLMHDGAVQSVAGFRIGESFGWRRHLYVHDFVTDSRARSPPGLTLCRTVLPIWSSSCVAKSPNDHARSWL